MPQTPLTSVLEIVVAIIAALYVMRQVRKPDPFLGRLFTSLMNLTHSGLTDWGLSHVRIGRDFSILDIGCGGGRTIEKLAAVAVEGKVRGVDFASGSVVASRARNAQLVASGRVKIEEASVSHMPFGPDEFDLATAIETQYYWPDPVNDMREILRVLKPGGSLVVIAESYKGASHDFARDAVMKLLGSSSLSADDQRELFTKAGYADVEVFEQREKGWICVKGMKP